MIKQLWCFYLLYLLVAFTSMCVSEDSEDNMRAMLNATLNEQVISISFHLHLQNFTKRFSDSLLENSQKCNW